jgi:circadian clock protein KaiC
LDRLLHGGLTRRTTTILGGAPGVGKTTLALHWALAEATPTTATLFVSFAEYPEQLQYKATAFGLDLEPARASGTINMLRFSPVEIMPDVVGDAIIEALTPNTTRLVIDDLAGLLYALGDRGSAFLGALAARCYRLGITTILLLEIEALGGLRINLAETALSLVAENVILLQQIMAAGRLHRILAVLKMRFSDYDQTLREVVMDAQGLRVLTPRQTAVDVLEDAAREFGAMSPNIAVAPTVDGTAPSED